MSQTIVLITGTNRGLGRALVERFLKLPNHTVVAANRNPEDAGSKSLADLPKGANSSLILTKYDARVEQSPFDVVKELQEKHGIEHLDIVIPNAAIVTAFPLARDVKRTEILEHAEVNVLSGISLFQATRDLLQKSTKQPIFAFMASGAGYIQNQPNVPSSAYGATKVMLYWYAVRINAEEEWLNTFAIDPGFVQTDMGNDAARRWGLGEATLTVDQSIDGVFQVLRTATKEKYGGKAVLYTGEVVEV
ncbi:putative NADPH-dependent 1-acyl dihydroxyacetone phosphate reductase [Xylaria curta]|nr:putative NADPH-dependent 1-acyl dihydroxyacetone phosphate reductase [Xylaria curta]